MTRFRWIAGDRAVVEKISGELIALVYDAPLPAGWVETILKMRASMESRIRTRGPAPIDLKLSRGGLVDIEFIAQMALLRGGEEALELHAASVHSSLPALAALRPSGPELSPASAARLADCYRHYREAQAFLRLTLEDRSNLLPEGARLERLARAHTGSHAEEYHAAMRSRMDEVRRIAEAVARGLASSGATPEE
jgi:glutamate-ammonia-ligase adenylyltransferase